MKKKLHPNGNRNLFSFTRMTGMIIILLVAFLNPVKASVSYYTFASSSDTYTPIAGTVLFSGSWDDSNSPLLTIPFSFSYNGNNYTTLGVNSNGFITLGALTNTVYCGLQSSAQNSIAGYGTDLKGNIGSTVQYATTGVAPNRQFVIQWTDCSQYYQTTDHYTFQIILNETTNTVQVVWGAVTAVTSTGANSCADISPTESGNVGLKGSSNVDFNIRSVTNGTNTWPTSVNGGTLSAVCNMSPTNFPASGFTLTWTPPVPSPMVFSSCTTVMYNDGNVDGQGSTSNHTLQVQVVTTGNLSPLDVTSLVLSTAGSTNPGADIANSKVYFTGLSGTFSAATQFGTTTAFPNGTYTLNGTATLAEGTNYFWVDYNITPEATIGNLLTGCCTQITGTGTIGVQVPTITCPAGSHIVGTPTGFWTPLANAAPSDAGGVSLVLSDGTVMCKSSAGGGGIGNVWNKLTPDASGSYANGTWTTIAPMISTRLYFSSQVLKDGRVYVAGGEYGSGLQQAEIYNPLSNVWTAAPSPGVNISDANSEILEDGRILQACVAGNLKICKIFDPVTNTYAAGPSTLGIHNESAWVKLPDNSVLMVDRLTTTSERYIPSLNAWVADSNVPVALYDPFGDETGGALLLPDGRAFFIGSLGHNAYYTPSGSNAPGVWAAAPDIPNGLGVPDGATAMLVNGKILLACSPIPFSGNHFPPPTSFFEFDYLSNTFTHINTPFGGTSVNMSCYITNMTALPDGNVLYSTQGLSQYYLYTPGTGPLAAGKPVISSYAQASCTAFNIAGTQFNGISQGASYGDDWQMATNYPVIRLTNGSNVYYCRTFNWNSTGVQRGLQPDNVQFTLPAGLPDATYSLVVTANGIASDPVSLTTGLLAWYNDMDGDGYYGTTQVNCGPPATGWSLTTLGPDCNDSDISKWQSASLYIDTDGDVYDAGSAIVCYGAAVPAGYSLTTNGTDCNDSDGSIHTAPTVSFSVLSASYCVNSGAVTLTGSPAGGTFSGTGISGNSFDPATAGVGGPYTITYSYTAVAGCGNSSSQTATVNNLPTVSFSGLSASYCIDAGAVTLTGIPAGGTFSGTGITGNTFNPAIAGVGGPYSITYSYTDGNSCLNSSIKTVTVNALPVVSFTGLALSYCVNASAVTLTGIPAGGIFSGSGVSGNSFNPATAGAGGPYAITYTYTDGNSCLNSSTQNVTVKPLPAVSFSGLSASYCVYANAVTLTGNPTGGVFSGPGITGNIFTPAAAGVGGPYSITYSYTDGNSCLNSSTQAVTVNPVPNAIASPSAQNSCSGTAITSIVISGAVSGATYNWTRNNNSSVTGMPASGTGNIAGVLTNTTNNPVTVTFTITPSANSCTGTAILATVLVNPLTKITNNPSNRSIYVMDNTSFSVSASGSALTYQWQQSTNGGSSYSNLSNGGVYSGVSTNKLNLFSVPVTMNGYKFRCVVSGTCSAATSNSALLTVTYPCQNATGLTTTNITNSAAKLNWSANADPAQWQIQYKTTNNGSQWKDVFVAGNLRTVTISSLLANQNYNWHIRAKCDDDWTSYSSSVSFKTLSNPVKLGIPIVSVDESGPESILVYPNPSKGEFTLSMQIEAAVNAKATIQLFNMMGKMVYTDDAEVADGVLQKTITTPNSFANGIYIIRVIIDDKLYKTQLIFSR